MSERRKVKLFCCTEQFVVNLMNWRCVRDTECYYRFPTMRGLPSDAEVCGVQYSVARRAWVVLVSHDSFDEVPDGCYAPYVDGLLSIETVMLECGRNGWLREVVNGRVEEEEDPVVYHLWQAIADRYGIVVADEISAIATEALNTKGTAADVQ